MGENNETHTHTFSLGGRTMAQCVDTNFMTTPPTMTLKLAEGVTEKEIRKLIMFDHFKLVIV